MSDDGDDRGDLRIGGAVWRQVMELQTDWTPQQEAEAERLRAALCDGPDILSGDIGDMNALPRKLLKLEARISALRGALETLTRIVPNSNTPFDLAVFVRQVIRADDEAAKL